MFFNDEDLGTKRTPNKKVKPIFEKILAVPMERINRNFELMQDEELRLAIGSVMVFDVECYWNYFCVSFKHVESKKIVCFELSQDKALDVNKLNWMLQCFCLVGFNSKVYDIPICWLAVCGAPVHILKEATTNIIENDWRYMDIERHYKVRIPKFNHIDLISVAPLEASLKIYAGRLHCKRMQDLPYPPEYRLNRDEALIVLHYNVNDLDNTELLYLELLQYIELREQMGVDYKLDLRSHSDAQIAEAVMKSELEKVLGKAPKRPKIESGTTFKYEMPTFIKYKTPMLQRVYDVVQAATFKIGDFEVEDSSKVKMPKEFAKLKIKIGGTFYKMQIGGLHSREKKIAHYSDENTYLIDRDVASYYPRIILNLQLFPKHIGPQFLTVYNDIVTRRLYYKSVKDRREKSLKITINGGFGKFGNKWSCLFSPHLMIGVTITGQLCLLMLIEAIELAGIPVVSGNTDGIVTKCPKNRYEELNQIIAEWETKTGFITEETRYKALYSRDVNNYCAVKLKYDKDTNTWLDEIDSVKAKGTYSERGSALDSVLSKNPETLICSDAIKRLMQYGTPIEETIMNCKDIRRFVTVRNAKGGAHKDNVYLGKALRWYYAIGTTGTINYIKNGNTVAKSEGAKPCMDLPDEFPHDINYDWYLAETRSMLFDLGYYKPQTNFLF